MKKLNKFLLVALLAQFALPVAGAEPKTAPAKYEAPEASSVLTKYEVSIDKRIVKDPQIVLNKIETAESFKLGQCSRDCNSVNSPNKSKNTIVFSYTCQKMTCEAFGDAVQPGVQLKTMSFSSARSILECPPATCQLSTNCSGNGTTACCRNNPSILRCPGF